jgi:Bax protein
VFVGRLPGDIGELPTAKERKRIFIKTMLPLILRANEEVFEARTRLLALKAEMASGNPLSKRDAAWLNGMYARYQLPGGDIGALLGRVDVVPTSLALAQAAEESGWGTSRFALEGNALFGQYTTADGDGLMPLDRSPERRFKVRAFEGLQEAVKAYVHNLNTHPAYEEFRAARADMRRQAGELDSLELSRKLERYSARGPEYVESIQRIIYTNDLIKLDRVQFSLPSA